MREAVWAAIDAASADAVGEALSAYADAAYARGRADGWRERGEADARIAERLRDEFTEKEEAARPRVASAPTMWGQFANVAHGVAIAIRSLGSPPPPSDPQEVTP
jgi:hypothetical protein